MDIYEYFNSRDVAEHCKKLGRNFTGREMAYLIWLSDHHTLHQKILAWEEIIRTMPDEDHEDFDYYRSKGLHRFLKRYITRLQQFLADFQESKPGNVYAYRILHRRSPVSFLGENSLFTNYLECVQAAVRFCRRNPDVVAIRISKRKLDPESPGWEEVPCLQLSVNAEPMDVMVPGATEPDLLVSPFGFYDMYVNIPTPFRRGDIVTGLSPWGERMDPMVISGMPEGEGSEYLDMCANLWELDKQGRLCINEDISYLSLEYYHGDLTKQQRFLYALQNHIQKDLQLEDLLRSYTITLLEFIAENRVDFYGWAEGMQQLAGLDKETILIP